LYSLRTVETSRVAEDAKVLSEHRLSGTHDVDADADATTTRAREDDDATRADVDAARINRLAARDAIATRARVCGDTFSKPALEERLYKKMSGDSRAYAQKSAALDGTTSAPEASLGKGSSGVMPILLMSVPFGVRYWATVTLTAEPSESGTSV